MPIGSDRHLYGLGDHFFETSKINIQNKIIL